MNCKRYFMKTLTKQLLLALALLSLCDQSNAQKRIQPDSGSEESAAKKPRAETEQSPLSDEIFDAAFIDSLNSPQNDLQQDAPDQTEASPAAAPSPQPMDTDSDDADNHTYDESLNKQLWDAASKGDTQLVKELLENGANPNANADGEDLSLLMDAVLSEYSEIVRILLEAGADVNQANENGARPLRDAAGLPSRAIVNLLIRHGANIAAQDHGGTTALICATGFNRPDNVQALIAAGANVNQANNKGVTPLMHAALNGNVAVLQALIAAGADVNQADNKGVTALMVAARGGKVEFLQGLLNAGADVTAVDNAGRFAIDWGRKNKGAERAIKAILEAKFEEKQRETLGAVADEWQSCPHELIQGPINEFLFGQESKGTCTASQTKGTTALIYAVRLNWLDKVQELIAEGANVNLADNEGVTPLMIAAEKGNIEILQLLLNAGADVTAVDNAGRFAIDWAQGENEDAIKAILEAKFEEKQREILDAVADEWQSCPRELIKGPINEFLFGQK